MRLYRGAHSRLGKFYISSLPWEAPILAGQKQAIPALALGLELKKKIKAPWCWAEALINMG